MDGKESLDLCLFQCAHSNPEESTAASAFVSQLERERDEAVARAEKAELRTLSLYTPLWEYGYDCNDYEAQAIVGEALQAKTELAALRAQPCRVEHEATREMRIAGEDEARACIVTGTIAATTPQRVYAAMERARVAAAEPAADERVEFDGAAFDTALRNAGWLFATQTMNLRLARALHEHDVSMDEIVAIATGGGNRG